MNKTTVFAVLASAMLFFSANAHAHGGGGGGHYRGGGGGGYGHGGGNHGWDGHDHGWHGHDHGWDGHNHYWHNDWHGTAVGFGFGFGGAGYGWGYDGISQSLTADAYQEQNVIINNPYPPSDSYNQDDPNSQNSQGHLPSFTAQISGPSTVKVGELVTVNLPYTAGTAPFTVLWRTDNNQPWSKGNITFQVRAMQQGPMNIQVVIRDNDGVFSAPQNVQVQVQPF